MDVEQDGDGHEYSESEKEEVIIGNACTVGMAAVEEWLAQYPQLSAGAKTATGGMRRTGGRQAAGLQHPHNGS